MSAKVLVVEKDRNRLSRRKRVLGKRFRLETAASARQALDILGSKGPFAVIVSEHGLLGPDGKELLPLAESLSPGIVKIILTEAPTLSAVMREVNENNVFGYFDAACDPMELIRKINAGITLYQKSSPGRAFKASVLTEEERLFLRAGATPIAADPPPNPRRVDR